MYEKYARFLTDFTENLVMIDGAANLDELEKSRKINTELFR